MVSANEIDLRKYTLAIQILREVLDARRCVPIRNGAGVQCPIVAIRLNPSVLFGYDVQG